jgi:hypothetical protein
MTSNATSVQVLHVTLPDHGGRNPLVLVALLIQECWTMQVAVQRLRDGLVMRMPMPHASSVIDRKDHTHV